MIFVPTIAVCASLKIDMKNMAVGIIWTLAALTWLLLAWSLVVTANRSIAPEPFIQRNEEDVKKAVELAIMTKRNSRHPKSFEIEKVALVGNMICMTYKGQNAFGEYTGEQALMEKNGNQPWYSVQDGFIDRWVKYCTHKSDDITDMVTSNLPRFEAALKAAQGR
jgi:hypothetical protein